MPNFRCYLLNSGDHILSVDSVEADDDAGAMELAGRIILAKQSEFAAIEVWDRARCIGKIKSPKAAMTLESLLRVPPKLA